MKKRWLSSLFLMFFLVYFCNYINATNQTDTLTIEDYYAMSLEELMDIEVISASKIMQKQSDAPNIITAIPINKINHFGSLSINEVLYYQPGFHPSYDYERRTIGFRGMFEGWNNNHYLMLIDGIPYNDNLYGTAYTWEITPLIFTKSLEIIRGAGGALYGTCAMNGVITLNTNNADDFDEFGIIRLRREFQNSQIYDFALGNENKKFGMVLSFSHYETDGNEYESYDDSSRIDSNGELIKTKTFDQRSNSYLFAKIYGKDKLEGLSFQFHEQHWNFSTGHGWLFKIPDQPESMKEYRRIFVLKYTTEKDRLFNWESAIKYQKHGIDWNMRYNVDGGSDKWFFYPKGLSEYLKTDAQDIWARLQCEVNLNNHSIITGVEGDIFLYNGDQEHTSNLEMNNWNTNPDTFFTTYNLDPWFEYIDDRPVKNAAIYMQYVSPKFFNKLQVTLSGRYDHMFFTYDSNLNNDTTQLKDKNYGMFTPRAAVVLSLNRNLSLKAIFGQAFRTPTPAEMFGSNTYTLASNIEEIEPEKSTNFDLGLNWTINGNINLKLNGYWVNFENIIAYSTVNTNLSTNVFSQETAGFEAEIQMVYNSFTGFFNYSFAKRLDEEITDTTIAVSKNTVTWTPSSTFNIGLFYNYRDFYTTFLFHYQGKVKRRESDYYSGMEEFRPKSVDSWINMDFKLAYKITSKIELGIAVKNLTNENRFIVKNYAYPFDYKLEKRSFLIDLLFRF